ncbi:hypothetical protein KBD81_01240 [Candidatus Woesebacteria bacterium]|nr:hypothetical protein [Candidatus Woesebacteria bacterium]
MSNITTIIAALGENPHLYESITSAGSLSKEIILLDMGIASEDIKRCQDIPLLRIEKIAPVSHVELLREKSKQYAKTDYILFLDPDEILPPQLVQTLLSQYESFDVVKTPRKNMIMEKWIQHARWWPDYQVRLFKKEAAIWPTEIHKQPVTKGTELILEPLEELSIIHYNYESLDEFLSKMLRYAKAEATTKFQKKESYTLATALKDGTNEFISRYFAADGYKDGMHGFVLSFLQMLYYPLVYFYIWEMKNYEEMESKRIIDESYSFTENLLINHTHWILQKKLMSKARSLHKRIASFLIRI